MITFRYQIVRTVGGSYSFKQPEGVYHTKEDAERQMKALSEIENEYPFQVSYSLSTLKDYQEEERRYQETLRQRAQKVQYPDEEEY